MLRYLGALSKRYVVYLFRQKSAERKLSCWSLTAFAIPINSYIPASSVQSNITSYDSTQKYSCYSGQKVTIFTKNYRNGKHFLSNCWVYSRGLHSQGDNQNKNTGVEMREKKVFTIPNILSFARIVACPFLGYLVLCEQHFAALLLFIIAGITDWLDGVIARRYASQMSYLGSILDPVADKLLVGVLTVTLTMVQLIPVPLAVIILGRDAGLVVSSFVVRFISLPRPRTLSRFFDPQLTTVQVTPSLIGKINTALQLGLISLSLTAPLLDFTGHTGLVALQYVVGMTTLISGVDYMRGQGFKYKTKPNT